MRRSAPKHRLYAAASIAALLVPAAALADTATSDATTTTASASAASDSGNSSVSEVIVTAMKRSETVQEVPAAITAVTSSVIAQRGITQTQDLQFAAPSLQVGTLLGTTSIAIRGVGLNQGSPGVGIYVDGVYQPRASMGDLAEIDLSRIEVLRGPQGTLYGRNTNGGAVNFISNAPTQSFGGYVLASAESYDEYRIQGELNVPLNDKWAVRGVLNYDDRLQGFIKNIIPGQQDLDRGEIFSGRLRLDGELTDKLRVDFAFDGEHSDGPFSYFTLHNFPTPAAIALNPYLASAIVPTAPFLTSANDPSSTDRDYSLYSATLTWDSPIGQVKSITAFQNFTDKESTDNDGINLSAFPSNYRNLSNTLTQEVNLTTKVGPIDAIVGAFFMQDNQNNFLFYNFTLGIFPLPAKSYLIIESPQYDTQSVAGYGDFTWNLTSKLRVIGGVRYSTENQDVIYHDEYGSTASGTPVRTINACSLREQTLDFSAVTSRGGVQYDINSDANFYGTVSEGYKAGGVNASACNNTYKPEQITAYEGGFKGRFLDHRLTFDVSGFYYQYDDLQLSQVVGLQALITNAAAARVQGVEFETDFAPDRHFLLNGSLTLLDAKYVNFTNVDSLNAAGNNPVVPCVAALSTPTSCVQNLSGNYLDNAPKVSANVGLSYKTDEYSWGQLLGRVDVSYRSTVFFREFAQPIDSQPDYTLVNLNLTWTDPSNKYSVRAFANNVGNVGYITVMGASNNFGSRYITWGTPRQYGVEVKASF